MREAYNLFNEYADILYGSDKTNQEIKLGGYFPNSTFFVNFKELGLLSKVESFEGFKMFGLNKEKQADLFQILVFGSINNSQARSETLVKKRVCIFHYTNNKNNNTPKS